MIQLAPEGAGVGNLPVAHSARIMIRVIDRRLGLGGQFP